MIFHVPVDFVVQGLIDWNPEQVAVVGLKDGEIYVAGSHATLETINLLEDGIDEIDRLAEDERAENEY